MFREITTHQTNRTMNNDYIDINFVLQNDKLTGIKKFEK